METRANYVLIGAFTVLTAVFLLLFALWAAKFSSDRDWDRYEVIFSAPVTGSLKMTWYSRQLRSEENFAAHSANSSRHTVARMVLAPIRT